MLSDHICQGAFRLNAVTLATELGVGTADSFLTVGALAHRLYFTLELFTPRVFGLADRRLGVARAARYELHGPGVASLRRGPLAHPGDGEYDRWEFAAVNFSFNITPAAIMVTLAGTSQPGASGWRDEPHPLPVQQAEISFCVLRPRMQEFLRVTDSAWSNAARAIDGFPEQVVA
jgi:hypothetical protein